MDAMTEEQLKAIEERAKAATPGPWTPKRLRQNDWHLRGPDGIVFAEVEDDADAAFIAHAREDIPALVEEVRRLRGVADRLRELQEEYGLADGNAHNRLLSELARLEAEIRGVSVEEIGKAQLRRGW